MKSSVLFHLLIAVYSAIAVSVRDDEPLSRDRYPRFIKFSNGTGPLLDVDLEEQPNVELLNEIVKNPANNLYLLFTRRNPESSQTLIMDDVESIKSSNFNPGVPTIVVAHGWLNNQNSELNPVIRKAYLDKCDVNVIIMDWSRLSFAPYPTACRGVPALGRGLAQFLTFLNQVTGAPFKLMHLIGFSLGAHLVGNAGRELCGRVARITGLDPAGPLWSINPKRLNKNDGLYVEAIHTDGGYTIGGFGIGTAVADVDFFPNGGISQPMCLTNSCNHHRAWELFAASVTYNHLVGKKCASDLQITTDQCTGEELDMGNNDLRKCGSGRFRVNTGKSYPF